MFPEAGDPIVIGVLSTLTSVFVGLTILASQTLLGSGRTSWAILSLFSYNVMLTMVILPLPILAIPVTVSVVLALWMVASFIGVVVSVWFYRRVRLAAALNDVSDVSISRLNLMDGLVSLPMLAGPWLLLFLVRLLVGIMAGAETLATFALAWTLVDLAYLAAINIPMIASREIMRGSRSPKPVYLASTIVLVGLVILGYGILVGYVAVRSLPYEVSLSVTVVLVLVGIVRLAVATWLPKSVADRRHATVSFAFVTAAVTVVVLAALGLGRSGEGAGLALAVAFGVVAAIQLRPANQKARA